MKDVPTPKTLNLSLILNMTLNGIEFVNATENCPRSEPPVVSKGVRVDHGVK